LYSGESCGAGINRSKSSGRRVCHRKKERSDWPNRKLAKCRSQRFERVQNMHSRSILCLFLILIGCLHLAGPVYAETISYADAVTALAKECGNDIKRHCKGLNLGNGAIQGCLEAKASKVTPTCTSTLETVIASIEERRAAQQNYSKVCRHAVAQRCKGMRGDGNILGCLIKSTKHISDECNQAITDAGWR
jgi:hypothetical protein